MLLKNTEQRFGIMSIALHWIMALLIIFLLCIGIYMTRMPVSSLKLKLFRWHKEFGMLALMLVSIRCVWRLSNITPGLTSLSKWAETSFLHRRKRNQTKSSKIEGLFKQVYKTINLLKSNPRHPGLNTHEYDSIENPYNAKEKIFEAYAQNQTPGAYRVFWCYGPEQKQITILSITPHP